MAIEIEIEPLIAEPAIDPYPKLVEVAGNLYLAISCYSMVNLKTGKTRDRAHHSDETTIHGWVKLRNKTR